jgi:putative transposase
MTIKKEDENLLHFLTLVVIDHIEIFINDKYFQIILNCLNFCRANLGLMIFEFVIMKDHLHLIVAAKTGYKLTDIISSFKKFTTKEIKNLLKRDDYDLYNQLLCSKKTKMQNDIQLWRPGNWPKVILTQDFLEQKMGYIHENPAKKGYVEKPEDWQYSSARNRILNDNSLIELDKYEF